MSAPVFSSLGGASGSDEVLGNGRMNCGFWRAAETMRWYVSVGMTAQIESGFEAWRRRQRASISLGGRARIFSTSKKESRDFIPVDFVADATWDTADWGFGGGGAEKGLLVTLLGVGDGGSGVRTVDASRRSLLIFSWWASFKDSTDSKPSLRGFVRARYGDFQGVVDSLFGLLIQLRSILVEDLVGVAVCREEPDIVDLSPSALLAADKGRPGPGQRLERQGSEGGHLC